MKLKLFNFNCDPKDIAALHVAARIKGFARRV